MKDVKLTCPVCGSHNCIVVDHKEKGLCLKSGCHKKADIQEFITEIEHFHSVAYQEKYY